MQRESTLVFVSLIILIASISVKAQKSLLLENEKKCTEVGGICVVKGTCSQDNEVGKKLCPKQDGDCCNRIPETSTNCNDHGGECMRSCSSVVQVPWAICPELTVCCVLV